MGIEKGPNYYNSRLSGVIKLLEISPCLDVYEAAVSLLPDQESAVIANIGCGTGRFARQGKIEEGLHRKGTFTGFSGQGK